MRHKVGLSLIYNRNYWDLIVLDESLSNIDEASQKVLLSELRIRKEEGAIIVIVDHNLVFNSQEAKTILMKEGRLYEEG